MTILVNSIREIFIRVCIVPTHAYHRLMCLYGVLLAVKNGKKILVVNYIRVDSLCVGILQSILLIDGPILNDVHLEILLHFLQRLTLFIYLIPS